MNKILFPIFFTLLLLIPMIEARDFKELVDLEVYFNDQKATVDNASVKVGETFTVKVEMTMKTKVSPSMRFSASGGVAAYDVIDGPSKFGESFIPNDSFYDAGTKLTYEWKLKPAGDWVGGSAPLNIGFTFYYKNEKGELKSDGTKFTVANIHIAPAGAAATPSSTGTQPSSTIPTPPSQPPAFDFLPLAVVIVVACGCVCVWLLRRKSKV